MLNRIKYKTTIQAYFGTTLIILICYVIAGIVVIIKGGEIIPLYVAPCLWILGVVPLIAVLVYNAKRNKIKENGKCMPGRIVGAYEMLSRGRSSIFYLKIYFFDNGEKYLCSEGYIGNPNVKLADSKCRIYKWKGRYIVDDFNTMVKGEKNSKGRIPTVLIFSPLNIQSGKVRDVLSDL